MTNAEKYVSFLEYPKDPKFAESIRHFQGAPTIAITKGGRIFMGWHTGGICEPHIDNYNVLIYSDDDGESWSEPVCVIESSRKHSYQALYIELWIDPSGALNIFWVQNNAIFKPKEEIKIVKAHREDLNMYVIEKEPSLDDNSSVNKNNPMIPKDTAFWVDGYIFDEFIHYEWLSTVENPDADILEFNTPRHIFPGFLRNKPLVLKNGREIYSAYSQVLTNYKYYLSDDKGKSFRKVLGEKRLTTDCDEQMCYQKDNGDIVQLARTTLGYLGKTISKDNGETWSEPYLTDIQNPITRFYVGKTPSGRVILVNNDSPLKEGTYGIRTNMTVYLSEDEGETWKYKKLIDSREEISYPDIDFYNGKIYLTYDRERVDAKEILLLKFTEEDIMNPDYKFDIKIVSKP